MLQHLFVYGTLAPGRPNEHVLAKIAGEWQAATVRGILRAAGWGAALGYPGIDLDESGAEVKGFLFSSTALHTLWAALDAFEGDAYQRVITRVTVVDGRELEAHIYTLRALVPAESSI
jgi:gamma-glutamylcyclotransferase (GGCT)/AIG2-like uncharacterized protein YtfP